MIESRLDQACIGAFEDPAIVDQAAQTSHGVGPTTEPKQKDLIAGAVVLNDVSVIVHDVLVDAFTGGAPDDAVVIRADAPVIEDLLRGVALRDRFYRARQLQHVGRPVAVEVFLGSVPGPVGTDYDSFHNPSLMAQRQYSHLRSAAAPPVE